jgi:hypothetical protein
MLVVGTTSAAILARAGDRLSVLRGEDLTIPGRRPARAYREYLGTRLGRRLGLACPRTVLASHAALGRLAIQDLVDAAAMAPEELVRLRRSDVGHRVLVLDAICANPDRRPANLLGDGADVVPIDFEAAFGEAAADAIADRWFGIEGIVELRPHDGLRIAAEAQRARRRLPADFLRSIVAEIPPAFIDGRERAEVAEGLVRRVGSVPDDLDDWWRRRVRPAHRLLGQGA